MPAMHQPHHRAEPTPAHGVASGEAGAPALVPGVGADEAQRMGQGVTIHLCCPKCQSIRLIAPAWFTETFVWFSCRDCGHGWNEKERAA